MGLTAKPNLPNFDQMTEPNADQILTKCYSGLLPRLALQER
jgi:hypothetical protein